MEENTDKKPDWFARFATKFGDIFGSAFNFTFWEIMLVIWIFTGHLMHYSNTWQLLANTPTTWLELFAAITIQYVGNRIERRQEEHEQYMIQLLTHNQELEAQNKAILEHIQSVVDHLDIKSKVPTWDDPQLTL